VQPLVSIIIPTYNRAHLIGETIDSILHQTYENWECIVVDDGSNDATAELLEFYCSKDFRIHYFNRPEDRIKGANACRNYGFELSKGDYINWFDSDDIMHPEKLKIQLENLIKSGLNYSVCQTLVFNEKMSNILGLRHNQIISPKPFNDYLMLKVVWMTPSALWRRVFLLTQKSLFDEKLQAAQEWEFHCRILGNCGIYQVTEEPLVYIRQHLASLTYNKNNGLRTWNYFLARLKVYKNSSVALDGSCTRYLQDYLLKHFKYFIRSKSFKYSINSLYYYVYTEKNFDLGIKLYATLSVFSYFLFDKGYFFLNKVQYSR